jgi:hypothetical protein
MMVDISQNFPSLANTLSRMELDPQVRSEVENNQRKVPAGSLVMSLNGRLTWILYRRSLRHPPRLTPPPPLHQFYADCSSLLPTVERCGASIPSLVE